MKRVSAIISISFIFSGIGITLPARSYAQINSQTVVAIIDAGAHGTNVATVVRAAFQLEKPVSGTLSILPVIGTDRSGTFTPQSISKGIRYAVDSGADIINLSLGGSNEYFSTAFNDAIQYAHDHDVLIIVSAGNAITPDDSGLDLSVSKISPVCNDLDDNMVLGVGASRSDGSLASWSNVGRCVDIFAPGAFNQNGAIDDAGDMLGTSFSSGYVAGIAARIHAAYPSIGGRALQKRIIENRSRSQGIAVIDPLRSLSQEFSKDETRVIAAISPIVQATGSKTLISKPKAVTVKKVAAPKKKIVIRKISKKIKAAAVPTHSR